MHPALRTGPYEQADTIEEVKTLSAPLRLRDRVMHEQRRNGVS